MVTTWWLSFCADDRPAGEQFLGVAIVEGESLEQAVVRAWALGLNPGGQVLAVELDAITTPEGFDLSERFLSPAEALEWGGRRV